MVDGFIKARSVACDLCETGGVCLTKGTAGEGSHAAVSTDEDGVPADATEATPLDPVAGKPGFDHARTPSFAASRYQQSPTAPLTHALTRQLLSTTTIQTCMQLREHL